MSITRNFKLFLNAGPMLPLVINVNQYDSGEQWVFSLFTDSGIPYTPSTGAIVGIKSDGLGIINTGTVVDGKVVITETQQMTAAPGKAIFELMIDDSTHGTANFIVLVEPKPGNNADLSESDLSMIQEAINAAGQIESIMGDQTITEIISPVISDWLEDNMTNPSNPAIDTSLTVAGAAADAKKTGDEISDLKSQIEQGGLNGTIKNILLMIVAVLRHAIYNADMSAVITQIESLINSSDDGGDDPTPQEVVITQSGTILTISNVSSITNVSQSGTILTLS